MEPIEPSKIGLCVNCRHVRVVRGGRSTFYLCQRSLTDPDYPKYPRLPVMACRGFEPLPPDGRDGSVQRIDTAPDDKLNE